MDDTLYWLERDYVCQFEENSFSKDFGTGTFNTKYQEHFKTVTDIRNREQNVHLASEHEFTMKQKRRPE